MLTSAAEILKLNGINEAGREAKSLLAFVLGKNQTFLVAHPEYELSCEEEKHFQDFVTRRAGREPFQYIVGKQEFFGLDFTVTKDVLIPRPETEMIVEAAVEILRDEENSAFCEIGIGSGCIAVSVLHKIKTARAVGLDVSNAALKIAEKNAGAHRVLNRLELKNSDVFEILEDELFDLIVSNPPYISVAEMKDLQPEVSGFEPRAALTDDGDGFSIIEKIISGAARFLKPNGFLLIEIGYNQARRVETIFDKNLWRDIEVLPDLQRIPRMVKAQIK